MLGLFGCLGAGLTAAAFLLQGRDLAAPAWLRDQIEARLAQMLPDARVDVAGIVAVVDENWRPKFALRDVRLTTPDGREIASFSDVRGGLETSALLDRQFRLSTLEVSGVFLTLRREAEGAVALSGGLGNNGVSREAPNLARLAAEMGNVLLRPGFSELTDVDVLGITLRYEDERANRAWTIDGGRMRLDRTGEDLQIAVDLALLGGGAQVATLAANYAGIIGTQASRFGVTISNLDARDIASQGAAFAWLRALDAPISGALRGGISEEGALAPLNATLQIGAGVIQPTPEARPIPIDGARSYFTYLPQRQVLRFDDFTVQSQWGNGRLEGEARMSANANGEIKDLVGQFRLSSLSVNPADFYPEPVQVEGAEMDFRLTLSPFSLELGRLDLQDQGRLLSARGTLAVDEAGWDIALDAEVDALSPERLLRFWPERVKRKTRGWISQNVNAGEMRDITGALRLVQGGEPQIYLGFDFAGADVRFLKTMPHIEEGRGHATLLDNRFVAVLDEGSVTASQGGAVSANGTSFIIPYVRAKPNPPAIVRLSATSPITAALSLLDRPPLEIMTKAALPVTLAQGDLQVSGIIAMPLKKGTPPEEIDYHITGSISDVQSDRLIRDRRLQAKTLALLATDDEIEIDGAGTLDGIPIDVVWRQPIGPPGQPARSTLTGSVEISPATLQTFNIALPPGMVEGRGSGDMTIELVKGKPPLMRLRSDLKGLQLSVPQISWFKPAETGGSLDLTAKLGAVPDVEALSLRAAGLEASGHISMAPDGQMERVRFDQVSLGGWLNAPVDLVGRGAGQPPGIVLRGGVVDLRRADFGPAAGGGATVPLTVSLNRLQVSDTIAITDMSGSFTAGGGLGGSFEGSINGAAPVAGQLVPQGGRSAIRLTSGDAGRVFAAAGLLKQVRDGKMELVLQPVGTGGAFDGKLRVVDIRVKDAPAIAALLNAISVVGLVNELTGEGILFSEITADFRLSPDQITLREASAVGASMGLSMDGVYVPDTGRMQMQGVISPVYLLNAIGSVLTRKGEGLIGFNYSITGTAKQPEVYVNPLTALAPGMFRNLFRGAQPEVPLAEGEEAKPPEPKRKPVVTRGEDR